MPDLDAEMVVRLPRSLLSALEALASERDETLGAIVRSALASHVRESGRRRSAAPPRPSRQAPDLEQLRSHLGAASRGAGSWIDVQTRLAERGLELAPKGGGLVLRTLGGDAELCKASELGFPYSRLIMQLGAGFPGHPHAGLVERVLSGPDASLIEE